MSTTRDITKMRRLSTADEGDKLFFRDPDEEKHQKEINTTEQIYRYIVDNKLYKKSSILKCYGEEVISDIMHPSNPHWIEFKDPPAPKDNQAADEEKKDAGPLFFRDPNEAKNQKLLKTTENIYRYVKDDKLYKEGSIRRAGHAKSAMSDKLAPQLPNWVEFRNPVKPAQAKEDEQEKLFFRDPNEKANQQLISTNENIYRSILDDKLYKKSSILKVYDESVLSEEPAKPLPTWVEMRPSQ